jgi:hypothetical protein
LVLGQIISAIDNGIMFASTATPDQMHVAIVDSIKKSFQRRHNTVDQDFSILHGFRQKPWPETTFSVLHIKYTATSKLWLSEALSIPTKTQIVISLGSGRSAAAHHANKWQSTEVGGTSRSIFSAFCDAIESGDDKLSGGAPQLVGLYSSGSPRTHGLIKNGIHYLHGLPISPGDKLSKIEWYDELFQRIDPKTLKVLVGARRFARPISLRRLEGSKK